MDKRKDHWQNVFENKKPNEVSWTQEQPVHSLNLIEKCNLSKDAAIIDVGGGDSNLVAFLLDLGYTNLTVLDISEAAIERAKASLGERAKLIKWIVSDVCDFEPEQEYALWHDRAAFHFLTSEDQIAKYVAIVSKSVSKHLVIATFSANGPLKCSGLEISQYSEDELAAQFNEKFKLIDAFEDDHETPFGTKQNFVYALLERK